MNCNDLLTILNECRAVFAIVWDEEHPSPLMLACAAMLRIKAIRDATAVEQASILFQLAELAEQRQQGKDPRCDQCIADANPIWRLQ